MLDPSLLQEFIAETTEHLEEIEGNVLHLERSPDDVELINSIFRSYHTIKGSAEYLGMEKIATLTHNLENLLDRIRNGHLAINREIIDIIISSGDVINRLVEDLAGKQKEETPIDETLAQVVKLLEKNDSSEEHSDNFEAAEAAGSIRDKEYDYDEELFEVFVQNMKESLTEFKNTFCSMKTADNLSEVLGKCLEPIDRLTSSANYMGYGQLSSLCGALTADVEACQKNLLKSQDRSSFEDMIKAAEKHLYDICILFNLEDIDWYLYAYLPEQYPQTISDSPVESPQEKFEIEIDDDDIIIDEILPDEEVLEDVNDSPVELPQEESEFDIDDVGIIIDEIFPDEEVLEEVDDSPGELLQEKSEFEIDDDDIIIDEIFPDEEVLEEVNDSPEKLPPDKSEAKMDDDDIILLVDEVVLEDVDDSPEKLPQEESEAKIDDIDSIIDDLLPDEEVLNELAMDVNTGSSENPRSSVPSIKATQDIAGDSIGMQKDTGNISIRIRSHSIRVDSNKIDALMNQVGELVVSRSWFSQLHHEMRDLQQRLLQEGNISKHLSKQINHMTFRLYEATSSLGRAAKELQEGAMSMRMLPVAQLFNRYPRLVHDLVKENDKQVDLEIRGEDTELDKMLIEKISDPMIHIIRNAIDHGIEKTSERIKVGKPETAKLIIEAYHQSNHIVIEVTDDGRGIDPDKIKAKVLEKNFLDQVELDRLTEREVIALITKPGFSTAATVTHTSGRGVGMDVVKKNIEKLNGTVEIDTKTGEMTRIRLKLPLTLAIIPALLVRVGTELFTIPLSTVEETIKVAVKDIESIEGNEVLYLRDETIPLIRMDNLFNISSANAEGEKIFVVIVSNGINQIGLVVDSLLGQEEIVIKPLEDYIRASSGFSGATILGDGKISLIIDIYDLLNISMANMENRRMSSEVVAA